MNTLDSSAVSTPEQEVIKDLQGIKDLDDKKLQKILQPGSEFLINVLQVAEKLGIDRVGLFKPENIRKLFSELESSGSPALQSLDPRNYQYVSALVNQIVERATCAAKTTENFAGEGRLLQLLENQPEYFSPTPDQICEYLENLNDESAAEFLNQVAARAGFEILKPALKTYFTTLKTDLSIGKFQAAFLLSPKFFLDSGIFFAHKKNLQSNNSDFENSSFWNALFENHGGEIFGRNLEFLDFAFEHIQPNAHQINFSGDLIRYLVKNHLEKANQYWVKPLQKIKWLFRWLEINIMWKLSARFDGGQKN